MKIIESLDRGSLVVIILTFVLFAAALFTSGLGHDLLLEAGVFLVSVKLIMMAYHNHLATGRVEERLSRIQAAIDRLESRREPSDRG